MPFRVSALNRKLLRDLAAMKGQAFAISMVVAAGVSVYVMYLSNFASLQSTRAAYYSQQRFADVFASLKRAPERVASEMANLPNVSAIETRVVANVTLDLEQLEEPASGRLISIPADRRPRVNDVFLRRGRWIEPGRRDEVLASEGFAVAHALNPGDQVPAVINGRLRRLRIVGIALSPEYIYSIAIARAMAARPRLLLFDEPTSGLDPITAKTVDAEIIKLRDIQHVTSILVTHQLQDAFYVATHEAVSQNGQLAIVTPDKHTTDEATFIMLKDGQVYFEGSAAELKASPDRHLQTYLSGWVPPLVA